MLFITENKVVWRIFVLVVLILSMLGPWFFDRIYVPAEYPCGKPTVRLYGDFCGYPMMGFLAFTYLAAGFFPMVAELIKGTYPGRAVELFAPLSAFIVILPFFSTALSIWRSNSRRFQVMNLIVWGLACVPTLLLFKAQAQAVPFVYLLWGLCSYIALAIGVLLIESLIFRAENAKNRA